MDDDPKLRTRLAMQLGEGVAVASFSSIEAMEEKFTSGSPLVAVFGPSYADPAGLKAVQGLTRYRPEVGSLMVVEEQLADFLKALDAAQNHPAELGMLADLFKLLVCQSSRLSKDSFRHTDFADVVQGCGHDNHLRIAVAQL